VTHPPRPEGVARDERYRPEEFSFLADDDIGDVASWRSFVHAKAERRVRRRKARTRIRAGLAVPVLLAALLAWHPWSRGSALDPADEALGGQFTALVQLRVPDASAVVGALASHDREVDRGSLLVVPADLSVAVAGESRLPVADALAKAGPSLTRDALADVLGVRIDASWVLDRPTFVQVVDRVGGLELEVARPGFTAGQEVVHAGRQGLTGAQAHDYATYLAPGEPEGARSGRVGAVLGALVAAMPASYEATRQMLDDLGVLGGAGLPSARLAALLSGLSRDLAAERARIGALPLRSGGALDLPRAAPMLGDLATGGSRGGQHVTPRVIVRFAGADPEHEVDVRALLLNAGYRYIDGGSSPRAEKTAVLVRERGVRAVGDSVALTLGLEPDVVQVTADLPATVDVLVLLARGYQPL